MYCTYMNILVGHRGMFTIKKLCKDEKSVDVPEFECIPAFEGKW